MVKLRHKLGLLKCMSTWPVHVCLGGHSWTSWSMLVGHRAQSCPKTASNICCRSLWQNRVLRHSLSISPTVEAALWIPRRYDFAYRLISIVSLVSAVSVGIHLIALREVDGSVRLREARGESRALTLLNLSLPKAIFVQTRLLILVLVYVSLGDSRRF